MTIVEQDSNMDLEPSAVIQDSAPVTMPSQTADAPDQPVPPHTSNGTKSRIIDNASSTPASDVAAAATQQKSTTPSLSSEVSVPHKTNVTPSATGVDSANTDSDAVMASVGAKEGQQRQAVQGKTDSADPASVVAEFEDGPDAGYMPKHHYASAIFRPQIDDIVLDEDLLEFYERLKFLISLSPLKTAQVLYAFSYATEHLSLELEVRRSVLDMNRKAFSFFQDNTWFMVDLEPEADPSEDEAYESSDPKFKILPARHSLFPAFQNQSRRQGTPGYASHPYYYHEQPYGSYGYPSDYPPYYMPPPRSNYYDGSATTSGPTAAAPLQQEDEVWGSQDDYRHVDHERYGKNSSGHDSRPSKRRHSREGAHGSSRSSLHESKKIRQDLDSAASLRSRHNQETAGKLSSLEPTSPHQSSSTHHGSEKHREKNREREHDPEREIARLERRLARKMLKYPGKYRHRAEDLVASSEARTKEGAALENPARGRTLKVTLVQSSKPSSSSLTQPSSAEGSSFDRPKPLHGWIPPADQIEGTGSAPSSASAVHRSIRPSDPDASTGADSSTGAPGAAAGQASVQPLTARKSKQPLQAAPTHGTTSGGGQGTAQDNTALYTDKSEEKLKKGTWTAAEEEILLEAVRDLTSENWHAVAMKVPGRNAKQCMQKWQTDLDPQINRLPWTAAEDEKLVEAYHTFGNAWQQIAKMVETRTWYQCYNRVRAKSVKTKIMETVGTHPASIAAGRAGMAGGLAGQRSGSVGAAAGSSSGTSSGPRRGSKDIQPLQSSTQTQSQQSQQPQQSQRPQQTQQAQQAQQTHQPKKLPQPQPPQQPQQRGSQPLLATTHSESRQVPSSQTPTSHTAGSSAEKTIHIVNETSASRGSYNAPNPGRSPELSYVGYKPGPTSQMLTHHTQQQTQSPQQPPQQLSQPHQQSPQPHQHPQQSHQQSQQPQQLQQPQKQHLAHQAPPQHPQHQQQHGGSWSKQAPSPVNQANAPQVEYHSPKHPGQQQQLSQQSMQHRSQISSAQSQTHSPSLSAQQHSHQSQMPSPGPSGHANVNSGAGLGIQGANTHGYNTQQSPHSKQQGTHYRQLSSGGKPMPHTPPPVSRQGQVQGQGQSAMVSSSTQPSPVAPTQASSPSAPSTAMMHHHPSQSPHSSQPPVHSQYPQGHRPPVGQKSHSYSSGSVQHMSPHMQPQGSQSQTTSQSQSQYQSQHQQPAQFSPSNNVYANGHQKVSSYSGSPMGSAPASSPSSQAGTPQHPPQVSFQHQHPLQQGGHPQAFGTSPPTGSGAMKMVSGGGGTPVPSISTFAAPPLAPPLLSPTIASSPTGFISTSALLMMARNAQASTSSPSSPASNPNSPSSGPGQQIPSSSISAPPGGGNGPMN